MRDNFSKDTKTKLALRVAYRCSYSGCKRITCGPGTEDSKSVQNLGEAAHINAASKGGPRYDPSMTNDERKSIDNGIWMCRHHARMIDTDYLNYSSATLKQWKHNAERNIYSQLVELKADYDLSYTLISLGQRLIFEGIWKSATNNRWYFEVGQFIVGSIEELREFSVLKTSKTQDNYIVVESQGDGRIISEFIWSNEGGKYQIETLIEEKQLRIDPNGLGGDIALGDDGDIIIENGDIKIIRGVDMAKQNITSLLGTKHGDYSHAPLVGSYFSQYYNKFKDNSELLNRMMKIEITRLVSIPYPDFFVDNAEKPALSFINRIEEVEVESIAKENNRIPLRLKLVWGNGEVWSGSVKVFV